MNETLINIITYILYIIALIIIVIFVLAIINYTLYTIYSIKEIVVHNTFEDAINYKLKDIYNYRLINYVNIINSDNNYNNNLFENVDNNDIHAIDMKEFTLIKNDVTRNADIDLSYITEKKEEGDSIKIIKDINLMKKEHFLKIYNLINFSHLTSNNKNYIINTSSSYEPLYVKYYDITYKIQYEHNTVQIIPEININKSIYSDVVTSAQSVDGTETEKIIGKKIIGKNGVIYVYNDYNNHKYLKNSNNNGDIYGYILNGLYLLIPTSLLWSYDKNVTELYVRTNNKLYEIILLLIFVILFIIFIAFIGDFYNFIFNSEYKGEKFFFNKIIDKDAYLVIIIISILAYCILHSVIYFFIFINGTYKKIKGIYDDLIIADEYVRYNVNNDLILKSYNNDNDIIHAFTKIAYGDDIDYMKGKYSIIDESNNPDIYKARTDFEKKMLEINYSFSYKKNIYSQNSYSNAFFNKIYNILKIDIDATALSLKTQYYSQLKTIADNLIKYKKEDLEDVISTPYLENIREEINNLINLIKIIKSSIDSRKHLYAKDITKDIKITEFEKEVNDAKKNIDDFIKNKPNTGGKNNNNVLETKKYIDSIDNTYKSVFDDLIKKDDIKTKLRDIKKTLLFITILYIYFVNNNIDDPYILIKLNKLVFGRVANIGIKEIDDEIDFTLSLKSLLGHNLHKGELIKDLNNINTELFKYIEEYEVKDVILAKALYNDSNPNKYLEKFQEKLYYIETIDYWGAVYFFNLYLAIELILNAAIILLILMIIKYTNNEMRENVEKYIIIIGSILVLIIDEIKTAILGVV
jgi:hypothetical protein